MKHQYIFTTIAVLLLSLIVSAQPGMLDNSFGNAGKVLKDINLDNGYSVALQSDGKILLAGTIYGVYYQEIAVMRYNTDGTLDSSFGSNGIQITSMEIEYEDLYGAYVAVQGDDKIIVASQVNDGYTADYFIVRYKKDGGVDSSFATNGIAITDVGTDADDLDKPNAIALQTDGKIVVSGSTWVEPNNTLITVVRYKMDGTLDSTFNNYGKINDGTGDHSWANAIVIQPEGKVVIAGGEEDGGNVDFTIFRYNIDGSRDISFGVNGIVTTAVGTDEDNGYALLLQPDGKLVVAGSTKSSIFDDDFALVRYTVDGSIDSTFGTNGKIVTIIGSGTDRIFSVALQPDGKILVAGDSSYSAFELIRYNPTGTPDSAFGANGRVSTPLSGTYTLVRSMLLQPDGKIVAFGNSNNDFAMARYLSDINLGVPDLHLKTFFRIYPNPLQWQATLQYELKADEAISIDLLNVDGISVQSFADNQFRSRGRHSEQLNLNKELPLGPYWLCLSVGERKEIIKIIAVK